MRKTGHMYRRGFTIVEMMVSIALFVTVLSISIGSLLSILDSYRKAQLLGNASSSLKLIMEDMTRNIAQGSEYHCDKDDFTHPLAEALSCENRGGIGSGDDYDESVVFQSNKGGQITYWLENGEVKKDVDGQDGALTTIDVVRINSLRFFVSAGEVALDDAQPRIIVVASGEVGEGDLKTTFDVQTTITQRNPK